MTSARRPALSAATMILLLMAGSLANQVWSSNPSTLADPGGPELILVPEGTAQVGSRPAEKGRSTNEGPVRIVSLKRFAMSRHEITVAEFRRFVEATGYMTDAERESSSTVYNVLSGTLMEKKGIHWQHDFRGKRAMGDYPVTHVSWNDAQAYVLWLSDETGQIYRLPTEIEFEYALRAGTTTQYWWGTSSPGRRVENLTGEKDSIADRWQWPDAFTRYGDGHWGPAPAGSFQANPFGLHDIGGNVMEWVDDCYASSLSELPDDGSSLDSENCPQRSIRGGSWASPPDKVRSAYRSSSKPTRASCLVGFRVARDID